MIKRLPVILLISIPAAAVLMGMVSMYFAFQGPNQEIQIDGAPLSKTSWQTTTTTTTATIEETTEGKAELIPEQIPEQSP